MNRYQVICVEQWHEYVVKRDLTHEEALNLCNDLNNKVIGDWDYTYYKVSIK